MAGHSMALAALFSVLALAAVEPPAEAGRLGAKAAKVRAKIRNRAGTAPAGQAKPSDAPAGAKKGDARRPDQGRKRLEETPMARDKQGRLRPLAYDPASPPQRTPLLAKLRRLPIGMRDFKKYRQRVDELVATISDADLEWSLSRLELMDSRPGTAQGHNKLVNKWGGNRLKETSPNDYEGSTLGSHEFISLFDSAMNLEEPTNRYQWVSAHQWANHFPRGARFMGISLPDRIIATALNGSVPAGARSIWNAEESRHAQRIEQVYNAARPDDRPPLKARGYGTHQPKVGARAARIQAGRRMLGEIGASAGYTVMRANAAPGSPADQSLEGIFRDEVYHHVLMGAIARAGYGQKGRFRRILTIAASKFERSPKKAIDWLIHEKKNGVPAKLLAEVAYAFNAVDRRVHRFLRQQPEKRLRRLVGPVYRTDRAVRRAIARGELTFTEAALHEQNPDLTREDMAELVRRFPGEYDPSRRAVKASEIERVIDDFLAVHLTRPEYWMGVKEGDEGKPAFKESKGSGGATVLRRSLGSGTSLEVHFPAASSSRRRPRRAGNSKPRTPPTVRVLSGNRVAFEARLDGLSMRQIGSVLSARAGSTRDGSEISVLDSLRSPKADLTYQEIVDNLSERPSYKEFPLRLDR